MAKMNAERARRAEKKEMSQMILDWCEDMREYSSDPSVQRLLMYRDSVFEENEKNEN